MDNGILFKILQADSLTGFLDWKERVIIHLYREGKMEPGKLTLRIMAAYHWITETNWEAPQMKYCDDCLQYFYNQESGTWVQAENYLKIHPEYKTDLNKLKDAL
jgi:hypothetical protein